MITEIQFKRIIKAEDIIWLCKEYFFNSAICIHKEILPYNFDTSMESSYKLLGFKGTIIEGEPDLDSIISINHDNALVYKATSWLFQSEYHKKKLYRKYESDNHTKEVMISNIYFENLPLITLFANNNIPNQHPLYNEYKTIIVMPVIT